jgi:tRNA G18 (ribose-2'-O)-methylase SpoU
MVRRPPSVGRWRRSDDLAATGGEVTFDPSDRRLDGFRRLNEPRYRRRYEEGRGIFIAEGPTVLAHIAGHAAGLVEAVLMDSRRRDRLPAGLDVPVYEGSPSFIAAVVGFDFHRGVLAMCRRPPPSTFEHLAGLDSLAVLEGISDHENLGAIIRAAAGLGVDGILLDPSTADPWYRRSVRVAVGTVVDMPMARSLDWPEDLARLEASGMTLVAALPDAAATDVRTLDTLHRPAILLGAEGHGLSPQTLAHASTWARIPMKRGVDSLNVGQAAAVMFDRLLERD